MALTDLLWKKKTGDGQSLPAKVSASEIHQANENTELSGLNFPGLFSPQSVQPAADPATQATPFVVPEEVPQTLISEEPDPRQNQAVQKEVEHLSGRARATASSLYNTFNIIRARMVNANSGNPVPLALVCAGANVTGRQLIDEVAGFEQNLRTAMTERDAEIGTEEQEALAALNLEVTANKAEIEAKSARIAELTSELASLRAEASRAQQHASELNKRIADQRQQFNTVRNQVRIAARQVAGGLAEEKRTFLSC